MHKVVITSWEKGYKIRFNLRLMVKVKRERFWFGQEGSNSFILKLSLRLGFYWFLRC